MGRNKRKSRKLASCAELIDNLGKESLRVNPIDISSRLAFPIIKNGEIESENEEEDGEETIELDFRPRKIFLPNSCLVCSRICSPEYLCQGCKMVSYCSDDHLLRDKPSHTKLCAVLSEFYDEKNTRTPNTKNLENGTSGDAYRILRVGLIKSTEISLQRYLDLWEKEIILYPRACFKCHANNERDLNCCPNCRVVFWCQDHGDDSHSKWCLEYKIFREIISAQTMHGNTSPHIPNVYFTAPNFSINNFDSIMSKVNNNSRYFRTMDFYNYVTLSHLASIPLTSLYALQEARDDWDDLENLVVHLIGSEFQYEGINLKVWEKLFLHFLPKLKILELVITGPELFLPQQVPRDLLSKVKLCSRCKSSGKTIEIHFVPRTLYHDYSSSSDYKKPNLTCLFNPGLYRRTGFNGQDSWPKTIYELCQSKVPILVTAYTEREIPMDIDRIKSVSSNVDVLLSPRKNPFASLKPDRNFVSDESVPLIYKNYFLSVVKARGV